MPKIDTSNGIIRYKLTPLYPGIKVINKAKATENLLVLKSVLDRQQIPFLLIAGTLLGAVREGDFIAHDEDIDLAFLAEDKQRVLDALPAMLEAGFAIARYNRRGVLSVIRQGEYIDLYFFRQIGDNRRSCDGWVVLEPFLTEVLPFRFKGVDFLVPNAYHDYLVSEYGVDWRTPVVWNDYQMPWWKKILLTIKEHVKEWLPDWLYFRLARRAEHQYEQRSNERLEHYFVWKKQKENE